MTYRYYDTPERPHVHTWLDQPLNGGSSVGSVIDKPLEWWASGMAVGKLGWIFAKKKINGKMVYHSTKDRLAAARKVLATLRKMKVADYLALLDEAYRAHNQVKEDKAESGTFRHKLLEDYIKPCLALHDGAPQPYEGDVHDIKVFADWALKNIKRFVWSEIHCYSLTHWTGGIADVGWIDMEDRLIAGDFKSSKEAYFAHWIQIAGYDTMLTENGGVTAEGVKVFDLPGVVQGYCVIPFGQLSDPYGDGTLNPEFEWEVEAFRKAFAGVVPLYCLKKAYEERQ